MVESIALDPVTFEAIVNMTISMSFNEIPSDTGASVLTSGVLGDRYDYHPTSDQFTTLFFGFYGSALATGFVGGRCADGLELEGEGAATALCRDALRAFFGSDIDKVIRKTDETAWRKNPLTLGSYSYAKPGSAGARVALATPLEDRLFFAGEATMPKSYSTVHGAYLSGQRVAQEILSARAKGPQS